MEISYTLNKVWLLVPSFLTHWVVLTALAVGGWWAWTRLYRNFQFRWQGPVLAAAVFAFYNFSTAALNIHQNNLLFAAQQQAQAAAQSQQASQGKDQENVDPVVKMKNEFLQTVDALAANPAQITDENLKKFDTAFAPLFKDDKERAKVYTTVKKFYDCQRFFWEDAMASFKSKSAVKSDSRKNCEKEEGTFFQREKLFTADVVKNNDTAISNFAAHKRVPASDGKEIEVTEDMLRNNLDTHIGQSLAVKKLLTR